MSAIYWLANLYCLPFWLLMILLPNWRWTRRAMSSPLVVAPPAALYTVLLATRLPRVVPAVLRPSLDGVSSLLGTPDGAAIGWLHYMMADLFVGRWIYLDARQRRLPRRQVSPVLGLAMVFSPAALLLYLGLRDAAPRSRRSSVRGRYR
jgi:hypothetical protein